MTRDDIIKAAGEAGFTVLDHKLSGMTLVQPVSSTNIAPDLARFAAAIIERCAGVALHAPDASEDDRWTIASAIRAEAEGLK